MIGRATAFVLALGLTVSACADGSELPPGVQCTTTSECGPALACSFNHCIVPQTNHLELMARLSPPSSSGLLPQQVAGLVLDAGPDLVVKLVASQSVRGVVTIEGDTFTLNVPGELEVRADDVIDGVAHRFTATSRLELGLDGFGYELVVLPGRAYTGTFRPDDDELPPHRFTLDPATVATGRFDLVLPAPTTYGVVSGRVRTGEGPKPILDARVILLGEGGEVLAVTRTDPERGQFEVLVAPDVERCRLKVESPAGGPIFPDFVTATYDVGSYVDVIVPDPPANVSAYDAVLQIVGDDGSGAGPLPIAGLTVTLQGVLDGGTLRRTTTTDIGGEAHFRVLSGIYECLVVVPPDLPFASWHGLVDLSAQAILPRPSAWTVTLAPRPRLTGQVLDAFGASVPTGTVTFERRVSRADGDLLAIAPPPITTTLFADGRFDVAVDPGTWDITVAPDPATGAPNTHESAVEVGPEGLDLTLNLPPPGLLHLTVADPDGNFLEGVAIELWLPTDDGPRRFATGTTGARGFVDILVPHASPSP